MCLLTVKNNIYQISRLKSGLIVATAEMPHMASVSLGLWVGVGGRYEPVEFNGISHFIEHMLFKGTRRRTPREISQAVEGIGGYLNAFTGEESTCFYSKARQDRFDELLDVLMDMFHHSTFDPVEIEKERSVIKEEVSMYLDQPQQHVQELLNETLWPDHPLGRPLTGTKKSIEGLGRGALLEFRRANYTSGSTLVVAAGNCRHDKVVKTVSAFGSKFVDGKRPPFAPVDNGRVGPKVRLFTKATAQTQMALGFRICSRHDPRRFALRMLNTLMGENMSSRLFQVLREEHGLAYSIHSGLSFFDDVGALVISAGLDADKLPAALKLILREVKRFVDEAPKAKELQQARDYLLGQIDLGLESTESQMMWLGDQLLGFGKIFPPSQIKQYLADVTAAQVRRVASEFLRPERMHMAVVSPLKSAAALEKHLKF
jgi:predicted Zn-dependent peptidase